MRLNTKLLIPSAALFWGLQFAFLQPALALLLVEVFHASVAEVGWVLAVYNASGFIATLILPGYADRTHDYLRPMLLCGVLTLALAGLLTLATTLPVAVIGLIVLGGPAGVGTSLLYAHLRHSGAPASAVVNTRAIVSFAWVAGPPLATAIIGWVGNRAILVAIGVVALLNIATTAAMLIGRSRDDSEAAAAAEAPADDQPISRTSVAVIVIAFIALQATNATVTSVMTLYVTQTLHLNVMWAGVTLGVAAALEIPALLLIGKLSHRFSGLTLIASGCVAGIAYYAAMAYVSSPALLLALQVLNAWFFAAVAGVGIILFQQIIPRPGLATGLYMNTRRIGAIGSGPIIGLGAMTALGYRGVFTACAALTVGALVGIGAVNRAARREPKGRVRSGRGGRPGAGPAASGTAGRPRRSAGR